MINFQEYLKEMSTIQPKQSASGAAYSVASAALNLTADAQSICRQNSRPQTVVV